MLSSYYARLQNKPFRNCVELTFKPYMLSIGLSVFPFGIIYHSILLASFYQTVELIETVLNHDCLVRCMAFVVHERYGALRGVTYAADVKNGVLKWNGGYTVSLGHGSAYPWPDTVMTFSRKFLPNDGKFPSETISFLTFRADCSTSPICASESFFFFPGNSLRAGSIKLSQILHLYWSYYLS